jgi:hypothetical protein
MRLASVLAMTWAAVLIVAACGNLVRPGPSITCADVPDPSCSGAVALVSARFSEDVRSASAIVIADTCPPDALCDRQFAIDLIVVIVPADPTRSIVPLHVFGTIRADQVAPWPGDIPPNVKALLPRR